MKKICMFILILLISSNTYAIGIGDTISEVKKQYGKRISVDESLYVFGNPPRAARIDIDANKYFGYLPTTSDFADSLKKMIPVDAKIVKSYSKTLPVKKEIYVFKSTFLSNTKGLKEAPAFAPAGVFTVYVNYDGVRILNAAISLGEPGEVDLSGTKKLKKGIF